MVSICPNTTMPAEKKCAAVVFAKVPGMGNAKSRIAAGSSIKKADSIYRELLKRVAKTVKSLRFFVSFTGNSNKPGELEKEFSSSLGFIPQRGPNLGERMKSAVIDIQKRGFSYVCVIGTDCPELSSEDILTAFSFLNKGDDVVIGPAKDGGYYLIAVKDPHNGVFEADGWGGEKLFEQTMEIMRRKNLKFSLLERKMDIDTIEDYKNWKSTCHSTILYS